MLYIKVLQDETVVSVEAHTNPVYVRKQPNGVNVRCNEVHAQGLLSVDGSVIYQLPDKEIIADATLVAEVITTTEYLNLVDSIEIPDIEDTDPVVPEESEGEVILTRAELTQTVTELTHTVSNLEEQLAATKILLGVE